MSLPLIVAVSSLGFAVLSVQAGETEGPADSASQPTFNRDVAPILYAHCTGCHQSGAIATAMPLRTYADARERLAAIKRVVLARTMPPWPADSAHSLKMRNDPALSAHEVDLIVRWIDTGAPAGELADLPPAPALPAHWSHPDGIAPDLVLSLPAIHVPATGEIPYSQQRVKIPIAHDRWVSAIQVLPGNYSLVHHMGITEVSLAEGLNSEQLDTFTLAARQLGMSTGALAAQSAAVVDPVSGADDMFGVYTPGTTFEMYRDGSAKLLKAGPKAYMNFNLHFTTTGTAQVSRAQLGLWFRSAAPSRQLFREPAAVATLIANGRELLTDEPGTKAEGTDVAIPPIAPYDAHYELVGMTAFVAPVTIYQLQPHAHMRAKDFKYTVVYPDGREVDALTVPNFDFHWQLAYELEAPLRLPAGAKLVVSAHYDNSAGNPHLRNFRSPDLARNCGPDKQAYFKRENQSWDEMFTPLAQLAHDALDPRGSDGAMRRDAAPVLPLVKVVGCLTPDGPNRWRIEGGSEPLATATQSTSAAELRATSVLSHGSRRWSLLGIEAFRPAESNARTVSIKGVLIGGSSNGINVTSLQPIGACQ